LAFANGPVVDAAEALQFSLTPLGQESATPMVVQGPDPVITPGNYRMDTALGAVMVSQNVTIPLTGIATPEVVLNAARISLYPRIGPNAAIEGTTKITVSNGKGLTITVTGQADLWLPAGEFTVTAQLDVVNATLPVTVVAGQNTEQDVFIAAAAVVPKVFYTAGQPVNADDLQIDIVTARPNVDGSRSLVSASSGVDPVFHLGAGDYLAITTLGLATVETPFSIALVQRTELPIILDAGVLSVTAPESDLIRIGPPPDIAGNAPAGSEFAADSVQETLNAGSYQVTAQFGDQTASAKVVITPGGRAEVRLDPP
jgi:Ca-activated chloride channel family protein